MNVVKRAKCQDSCPNMAFECGEGDLFNLEGRCVTEDEKKQIEKDEITKGMTEEKYSNLVSKF